jgi:hypothetical protein
LVKIISINLLPPLPTIMRVAALLTTLFAAFACGDAFVTPVSRSASCVGRYTVSGSALPKSSSLQMSAFDGIKGPVQSYVDIWTPMFKQASESGLVPDFLLHWGHGAAMASVLLSMGVIGAYMGWQIRLGNGEEVTPLTLGETIREAHPKSKCLYRIL